jgi:hypothetical protein
MESLIFTVCESVVFWLLCYYYFRHRDSYFGRVKGVATTQDKSSRLLQYHSICCTLVLHRHLSTPGLRFAYQRISPSSSKLPRDSSVLCSVEWQHQAWSLWYGKASSSKSTRGLRGSSMYQARGHVVAGTYASTSSRINAIRYDAMGDRPNAA